jgi:hypothetical protein
LLGCRKDRLLKAKGDLVEIEVLNVFDFHPIFEVLPAIQFEPALYPIRGEGFSSAVSPSH